MSSKIVPWGACALVLSFAVGARAETGEVRPAEGSDPTVQLEETVVRLPRAEAAGDPTASATVVQADRFAGQAKDVAALVATAPGVAVNEYGGLGQLSTVSIRGSMASGVLVLIDGLPLDGGGATGSDLASIPRHWVDRLEVVRGAEGAHFGAGAMAGVVNVVTRRPAAGDWSAEVGAGSFGTLTAAAEGGLAAGAWTLLGAGSYDGTRGDFPYLFDERPTVEGDPLLPRTRENNGAWRGGLLLKAARPAGSGRLDLLAQASAGRRELAGSPYLLTPHDWQEDGRVLAAARLGGLSLGSGVAGALRLHGRVDQLTIRLQGAPTPTTQRGAGAGAEGELTLAHPAGQLRLALAGGGETLTADGVGGERARASAAASVSDDLSLANGRLRLAPALRGEVVGPFAGLSAKLGASLALAQDLTLRASAGRSFRAPSFAELYLTQGLVSPNPDLQPEHGVAADAAVVFDGAPGLFSLGGFVQLYQDLILYQPATFDRLKPFNAGKALTSGMEVEVATAPAPRLLGLTGSASYTLLITENLRAGEEALGKWLPLRARHRLFARVAVSPEPVELHAEVHHVGLQYRDPANTRAIPAATVLGAGGSVRLGRSPAVRLHLEVENLTDDRTLQDGLGNPLPGRMVMLTLRAGAPPHQGAP